jgi:hypothetical protein
MKILILILLLNPAVAPQQLGCLCGKIAEGEKTHWGNSIREPDIEKDKLKLVRGVVKVGNDPLSGALVEVFDNPEARINREPGSDPEDLGRKQNRVAACKTGGDGQFCFSNIPAGKYELRISHQAAFDPESVIITVAAKGGSRKRLQVALRPGI